MCILLTYLHLQQEHIVYVFIAREKLKTPLYKMTIKECCVTANVDGIKMILVLLAILLLTIGTGNNVLAEQGEGWVCLS